MKQQINHPPPKKTKETKTQKKPQTKHNCVFLHTLKNIFQERIKPGLATLSGISQKTLQCSSFINNIWTLMKIVIRKGQRTGSECDTTCTSDMRIYRFGIFCSKEPCYLCRYLKHTYKYFCNSGSLQLTFNYCLILYCLLLIPREVFMLVLSSFCFVASLLSYRVALCLIHVA